MQWPDSGSLDRAGRHRGFGPGRMQKAMLWRRLAPALWPPPYCLSAEPFEQARVSSWCASKAPDVRLDGIVTGAE